MSPCPLHLELCEHSYCSFTVPRMQNVWELNMCAAFCSTRWLQISFLCLFAFQRSQKRRGPLPLHFFLFEGQRTLLSWLDFPCTFANAATLKSLVICRWLNNRVAFSKKAPLVFVAYITPRLAPGWMISWESHGLTTLNQKWFHHINITTVTPTQAVCLSHAIQVAVYINVSLLQELNGRQ